MIKNSKVYTSNIIENKDSISELRFYEDGVVKLSISPKIIINHSLMKEIKIKLDESRNKIAKWRNEFDNLNNNLNPDNLSYSEYKNPEDKINSLTSMIVNESAIIERLESCREIVIDYLIKEVKHE
ncbi:hypothetical protein DVV91_09990 [Clostridium botulinum]|uniref:hypothetical protein n=1 Tax=Clostridium botulinum TaxID=1491 RepID=UPI00196817DB|nr:hypothetical protein [Clostridium botulinum]MBN1074671.1 hypothetical protein [Clostridium botulinum]